MFGLGCGDRLTSVNNAGTVGAATVVMGYDYDAVNNLTVVTDTINGVLGGVKLTSYDALNRVVRMTQSGAGVAEKRIDLAYDAASQMTSLTRYSDLAGTQLVATSDYSFDGNGRLTNLTHHRGGTVLADYGFVYDAVNRITQMTSADGVSKYDYDLTNQLTGADYNYQTDEAYSYDANGNRTNAGYGTGTYNQLLTDGIYTYEYDAEGNRTKRTEIATGEVTEYLWDYRNCLTEVRMKDASGALLSSAAYTYDVNNQRIAKVVDADGAGTAAPTTERFVYDGDHIALTFDGAGVLTERFFHGPMIDQVIAQEGHGGLVSWALADHLGTIRDVINSNGAVLNHLVYDSFGEITSETNPSVDFRFSYTGREFDEETGQYYYRARYYDANVGEFISTDPIGFLGEDLNLYRYVSNAPSYLIDPEGYRGSPPVRTPVRRPIGPGTGAPISPGNLPYRPNSPGPAFDPSRQLAPPDWTQNIPRLPEWAPPLSHEEIMSRMRRSGKIQQPSFGEPLLQPEPRVKDPNQCKKCELDYVLRQNGYKDAIDNKGYSHRDNVRHNTYAMHVSGSPLDMDFMVTHPILGAVRYDGINRPENTVYEVKAPRQTGRRYWLWKFRPSDNNQILTGKDAEMERQKGIAEACDLDYMYAVANRGLQDFLNTRWSSRQYVSFVSYPPHMLNRASHYGITLGR